MLDNILVMNRGLHIRDTERGAGIYAIRPDNAYTTSHDFIAQEVA